MKDFLKWLGVNEKVAKLIIWIAILMTLLILTNAMLDSFGLPYYKVTYENLVVYKNTKLQEHLSAWIIVILNFYAITLLVFRVKDAIKIIKYALLYVLLNIAINFLFNYAIGQVFIVIYILAFCYLYSGRKKKYILYGLLAIILNIVIQYVAYTYKIQFIDYTSLNRTTRLVLSFDYFIIIFMMIVIKEIYLIRRNKKVCLNAYSGSENSTKKKELQTESHKN